MQSSTAEFTSVSYQLQEFLAIAGPNPTFHVVLRDDNIPFAHDAAVYLGTEDAVIVTSRQHCINGGDKHVAVSKCQRHADGQWTRIEMLTTVGLALATGGVAYKGAILFCQQGDMQGSPSALILVPHEPPHTPSELLYSYNDLPFNSLSDVTVDARGLIWFTDSAYGYEQGNKPPPKLPCMVHYFNPDSGDIRAVADGFDMPSGIAFSPDGKELYVTDTGKERGDGSIDETRPSTM